MSKIYDALIQAAKNSDSRAAVFRSSTDQERSRSHDYLRASHGKLLGLLQL